MTINEIREKYLKFFESKGHKVIPPAPLVLQNDPTTLFTSSGMQPLVPYLMGQPHPDGNRVTDSQPSIRTQDIEEVGDNRHTTFFEMLGNWSFGDYFKEEQLTWIWEFLTEELVLPKEKLYVSIFEGDDSVSRDEESYNIWKRLGLPDDHIFEYGVKKNWWSRSGTPDKMPAGEIGGPDSEIFFDFGSELELHENSQWKDEECHPNCDCGRFLEIGNSVFIQYKKNGNGTLEELPQKNVDFGGGLERIAAALNNNPDVFKVDVFNSIINSLEKATGKKYGSDVDTTSSIRIIADHIRAANSLAAADVKPSNKLHGYVMRRLIRRACVNMRKLKGEVNRSDFEVLTDNVTILDEVEKFNTILRKVTPKSKEYASSFVEGMTLVAGDKTLTETDSYYENLAKNMFYIYQSHGYPAELMIEDLKEAGATFDQERYDIQFQKFMSEHQEKSRTASAGAFKGGLADRSEETTRLHTATHLLHAALRKVLGENVQQKGSNITAERLRFDFTHTDKLTEEQIEEIESLVNEQIDKDLQVSMDPMTLEEAKEKGALAFFGEKYGEKVNVYSIGDFSKEVCGGPHVQKLSDLKGHVTITKQDNVGSGVRRIYAQIS